MKIAFSIQCLFPAKNDISRDVNRISLYRPHSQNSSDHSHANLNDEKRLPSGQERAKVEVN